MDFSRSYQQSEAYKANHPKFAQADTKNRNWNKFVEAAENERAVMVAEFHTWCVKTRMNTETDLMNNERFQHDIAPFAEAALAASKHPSDVPMVVFEFATQSLRVLELQRKLNLLNVYYRQAACCHSDMTLQIEPGNEGEINQLWDWFMEDRVEEKKS